MRPQIRAQCFETLGAQAKLCVSAVMETSERFQGGCAADPDTGTIDRVHCRTPLQELHLRFRSPRRWIEISSPETVFFDSTGHYLNLLP